MNIALVFAGGTGQRMNGSAMPKQFLEYHDKPIIIYTLEHFENHRDIDKIVVVCKEEWIPYLKDLLKRFHITKVESIVAGGNTGQHSISNGLDAIRSFSEPDSVILIHDGVRPLIDAAVISANILCAKKNGNAITVAPVSETVITQNACIDQLESVLDRKKCKIARAPQSFMLRDICAAHQRARQEGLCHFIDSASMMHHYGYQLFLVDGPVDNIKITTPIDFYVFRALEDARGYSQILTT